MFSCVSSCSGIHLINFYKVLPRCVSANITLMIEKYTRQLYVESHGTQWMLRDRNMWTREAGRGFMGRVRCSLSLEKWKMNASEGVWSQGGPKAEGTHIAKNYQYHFLKQGFIVPPFECVIHPDWDGRIARAWRSCSHCVHSWREGRCMLVVSSSSPLYLVWDPSPRDGATNI